MARKKAQVYHVSQIEDWQGPPMPTAPMPEMRPVASHDVGAPWQGPVQAPQMRARTMGERVGDFVGSLVEQPLVRIAEIAPRLQSMIPRLPESPYVEKIAGDLGPDGENMVRSVLDGGFMAASLAKPPARTLVNGLYSRLDEAAQLMPKKGVPATGVMNWLKKAPEGISLEEAQWRKLPQWLESHGTKTVTPEMLAAYLKENPAPFPNVKTLGGTPSELKSPGNYRVVQQGDDVSIVHPDGMVRWSNNGARMHPDEINGLRQRWENVPAEARRALPEGYRVEPLRSNAPGAQRNFTLIGPDGVGRAFHSENVFQAHDDALAMLGRNAVTPARPKFSSYQVPGGENYRETLQTLPVNRELGFKVARETVEGTPNQMFSVEFADKPRPGQGLTGFVGEHTPNSGRYTSPPDATKPWKGVFQNQTEWFPDSESAIAWVQGRMRGIQENIAQHTGGFRSSHYPDDPNLLVHTRANDRTLPTGERIRYGEEAQSDWFQTGAREGYIGAGDDTLAYTYRPNDDGLFDIINPEGRLVEVAHNEREAQNAVLHFGQGNPIAAGRAKVPDAPFKDTWPDLGLKQMYWEAANDPALDGIGFTGAKTQVERWGTERLAWEAAPGGGFKVSFEPQVGGNAAGGDMGAEALRRGLIQNSSEVVHSLDELKRLVGNSEVKAEKAWKRMNAQPEGGLYQPRAEGMTHFYDETKGELRNRAAKIVKPFGGTVEPGVVPVERITNRREDLIRALQENDPNGIWTDADNIAEFGQPATMHALEAAAREQGIGGLKKGTVGEPSWLSRLTPEMKAAMRERGFPLMSLAGPVAAQGIPDDPNSDRDDYARLALNLGSVAALGMAAKGAVGKRMSAAEAEAAGLWHPVGEGKRLDVPVSEMRYQREPMPMPGAPDVKTLSPESMQGAAIIPAVGDRSIAGARVTSINDIPLERPVIGEGGPGFMRTHDQYGTSWASESNAITKLANRTRQAAQESIKAGGNGNVFMVYMPTSHAAVDFSTMMTDALLEQARAGKITKTGIKQFDARVRKVRPEWLGIMHKDAQKQLGTLGELRHAFVDAMKVDEAARSGFPDLPTTRAALTEPALMDTPSYHGGFAVAKLDPSGRVVKDPLKPHTTYNTQLGGNYAGQLEKPVPLETLFSDFHAARRAGGKDPGRDIRSFMLSNPIQIATPQWVEANMKFLKSSGAVVTAVGAGTVLSAMGEPDEPKSWRDIRTHQKGKKP